MMTFKKDNRKVEFKEIDFHKNYKYELIENDKTHIFITFESMSFIIKILIDEGYEMRV